MTSKKKLLLEVYGKSRAYIGLALYLNSTSGIFYDSFNHIQAYSRAFYMVVKSLKHSK